MSQSPAQLCDPDRILTVEEQNELQANLAQALRSTHYSKGTACEQKGLTIIVYLVRKIQSVTSKATSEELKQFAKSTALRNRADSECNKDVTILVSTDDKGSYIQPGSTLAALIPPTTFGSIAAQRPIAELKASQWQAAINKMVVEVIGEYRKASDAARITTTRRPVTGSSGSTSGSSDFRGVNVPWWIWPIVALTLLTCCCCCCCSYFCKGLRDCFCPCCKDAPSHTGRDYTPAQVNNYAPSMPWYQPSLAPPAYNMRPTAPPLNDPEADKPGHWGDAADGGHDGGGGGSWDNNVASTPLVTAESPPAPSKQDNSNDGGGGGTWG